MWSENEKQITKITMQVGDVVTSWEAPFTDCGLDDLLNAFAGLLIGHTWLPTTVFEGMKEYAEDNLSVLKKGNDEVND
jgi:hypothetical protein